MKCYTVTTLKIIPGLSHKKEPYPHIGIGRQWQGGKYIRIPVATKFAASLKEDDAITEASIFKTKEKGLHFIVEPEITEDKRALVYLGIFPVFAGEVSYDFPDDGISIIATGSGPEYLVIMYPETTIQAHHIGILFGSPKDIVIYYDGNELKMGEEDVISPPDEKVEGRII